MQIKRTNVSETEVKLEISAESTELDHFKAKTLKRLAKGQKVSGFRQGKAPLALIEKALDPTILQTEFLEDTIGRLYMDAAIQEKLKPIDRPDIALTAFVPYTTLSFVATVQTIGEVTLSDYKKIKKSSKTQPVEEQDVDEVIENLRLRLSEKKDVDRVAKSDDQVIIDFEGKDAKGENVAGASGKDYPLILGSKTFIPGFEEHVVGMKAGETKTFHVTFPKDYGHKPLAGTKVEFTVTMHKVQEVVLPKVDAAFAAKSGPFKTVDELRKDIRQQLEHEKTAQAQNTFENELLGGIVDKSRAALPEILVKEQLERSLIDFKQNLVYRGVTISEYLTQTGLKDEDELKDKELRPEAERRVKTGIVLTEIAEKEGIEVTPEELEVRLQLLKGQYASDPTMQAELDKPEARRNIASQMMSEKTVAKLVEYAKKG